MRTLDEIIAATVRRFRGGDGVPELADRLGISLSMLYRASNPLDEGAHLSSRHLVPLMEATGNDSILQHLAARRGYLLFRMPRVKSAREGEIAEWQRLQGAANLALLGFFSGSRTQEEALEAIRCEMAKAAGFLKAVQEHPQPRLFEEEP